MARQSYQRGFVQEKNGRYTLRYRVRDAQGGWRERREALPLGISKREALKRLDERVKEANALNNDLQRVQAGTFAEFTRTIWADYTKRRGIKPSTLYSYDSMLDKHILPEFGSIPMSEITVAHLTRFFNTLGEQYSTKYVLNVYALLNVMFEVAQDYDIVETIPLRAKIHRPQHRLKKKMALTIEQLRMILDEVPERYKLLILTAMLKGARLGEVRGLRWMDLDADGCRLHIRHSLWRGLLQAPKTEASIRTLHLSSDFVEMLLMHRLQSRWSSDDDFIFAREDGTPHDPDHLRNVVLYPAMDRCGIERTKWAYGFHAFRHTAGSIVHERTGDLKLVQELLGHSRLSTTSDIYVHVSEKMAEQATEILAREIVGELASEKVQ